MPTSIIPSNIITAVATLMNDSSQTQYTNSVVLPFLNMALDELQEVFELNGLPVTNETSAVITVPAQINSTQINIQIGPNTTPALPADLIEIQQLWESPTKLNRWTEVVKREFLPHYLEDGTTISQFLIWSWEQGQVNLIAANQINDLKMDYTALMFNTPILIQNINISLPFINIGTYLQYKAGALAAMFIAENPERAGALDSLAGTALNRAIGIPVKGMQSIVTRRKPFRFSFKNRGTSY